MSKPVSPLTKDTSRVRTRGDEMRDDYLQAWQDMFSNARNAGRKGEVLTYDPSGVTFASTGTPISIVSSSNISTLSADSTISTTSSNGNDQDGGDDDGGWFDGIKEGFKDIWGNISERLSDAVKAIFGTLIMLVAVVVAVYVGAAYVDDMSERIQQLRNREMTRREALVRVIRFDIFQYSNEVVQKRLFTRTFDEVKEARQNNELKGFRDTLASITQGIVSFDVINTVFNKSIQKTILTITRDGLHQNKDSFKNEIYLVGTGSNMRVHVKRVRDFTNNRAAHIFDMIVTFDIFKSMDNMVESVIGVSRGYEKRDSERGNKEENPKKQFVFRNFSEIIKDHDRDLRDKEEAREKANSAENQKDKADTSNTAKDAAEENEKDLVDEQEERDRTDRENQEHNETYERENRDDDDPNDPNV